MVTAQEFYNGIDYISFEALMVATNLLDKTVIRDQNRQNLAEFVQKAFGSELSSEAMNQALDALETQSWSTVKASLFDLKTTELYRQVWGEGFAPTAEQLEEGRSYSGRFAELKALIDQRYNAIIVTIIVNSVLH